MNCSKVSRNQNEKERFKPNIVKQIKSNEIKMAR